MRAPKFDAEKMSTFEHNSKDWFDDEIRRVPLPEQLLVKLRAIATSKDEDLDEALREIAVPQGLFDRLRGITSYSEECVDAEIRDVHVPTGLIASLRTIPEYADSHIDADLRDVPIPIELVDQLRRIATEDTALLSVSSRHRRRRSNFIEVAAAVSLLLMIGTLYLTAMFGFVATAYYEPPQKPTWELILQEPAIELQFGPAEPHAPLVNLPLERLPELDPAGDLHRPVVPPWTIAPRAELPENELRHRFNSSKDHKGVFAKAPFKNHRPFTAPDDGATPLRSVDDIKPQGIVPNWVRADLLQFLLVHEVHPFISPAAGQTFLRSPLPLVVAAPSFDHSWEELYREGASAEAVKDSLRQIVRTEEFIQAIDYGVPAANSPVSLHVLGGPSPFGAIDSRTLQVIAQGGKSASAADRRTPADVTVVVDISTSMREHNKLSRTREALKEFVATLRPGDRVSLIAHCETARVLLNHADADRKLEILAAVDQLQPQSGNNIDEAMRLAALSLKRIGKLEMPQSLVVISDGVGLVTAKSAAQIARVLSHLAEDNIRVAVIDLTQAGLHDPLLPRLAAAGRGSSSRVSHRQEMVDALRAAVGRRRPVVAEDVRVTVHFNPSAVSSYRLLGHEPTSILDDRPVEIDLRAHQAAAGLFEINLIPQGDNDVGWVEISWRGTKADPQNGTRQSQRRRISRIQFAQTFAEAPMPVQAAIIAAETAELLRGSPYADRPQTSLAAVRDLADQVDLEMAEAPSFKRFVRFIDRALQIGLR